ncbi:hypothetical protein TWF281_011833 [Arthrobotrys megalospora]
MKTLTLFLVVLRLTSALPTPVKVDVNASPAPGAKNEAGETLEIGGLVSNLLGGTTADTTITTGENPTANAAVNTDIVGVNTPSGESLDIDLSSHCCFDADKVLDKTCDIPICIQKFFTSEQGKPVADAILAAEVVDPSVDINTLVLPSAKAGVTTGKKVRRGSVVTADVKNLQVGGKVLANSAGSGSSGGDVSQCTVQIMNDGNFGSDAPLCQQLLLDLLAPAAGCVHREAGKLGNAPLSSSVERGNNNVVVGVKGGKVVNSLAELEGN